MKSSEFLTEADDEEFDQYAIHDLQAPKYPEITPVKTHSQLRAIIEQNCSIMLAAYRSSKKVMFRGINGTDQIIATNIRPDRRPVEMYPSMHDLLHKVFQSIGLKATRTNSIFCTSNFSTAEGWGRRIYVPFVRDGWTGTIFKKVKNEYLFNKVAFEHEDFEHLRKVLLSLDPMSFNNASKLSWILKENYDDILITGSSYIAIRVDATAILDPLLGFSIGDLDPISRYGYREGHH